MNRTVTATEAKAKLSELMRWAVESGDGVIVESHGAPQVVLVPFAEYEELRRLKERARREDALNQLRDLARDVQKQNKDLTADEAAQLADEITRAAIESLAAEGRIKFEI